MYACVKGIDFVNYSIGFWDCSNSVVFFVFHFITWLVGCEDVINTYAFWNATFSLSNCFVNISISPKANSSLSDTSFNCFFVFRWATLSSWFIVRTIYNRTYLNTHTIHKILLDGLSWPWSHGSWIYNYLCNQCLSPLMLRVRILIKVWCTTLCDKVCQWLATGWWFSPGPPVSSTNKTDRHDITGILLK